MVRDQLRKVCIIGGSRIPFARSNTNYANIGNLEMMSKVLTEISVKYKLAGEVLGEVACGAVITHSRDWNLSREAMLNTEISPATPAYNVQQACGTSLQTCIQVANKIALGQIECGIAGGTDTTSDAPIAINPNLSRRLVQASAGKDIMGYLSPLKGLKPKDLLPVPPRNSEPRTGKSMGEHCELMAQEWEISRDDQDKLAMESHHKAARAYDEGFFDDLLCSYEGLSRDNNLRPATSLEKLAKLKPAFDKSEEATLTAGNSTPLTDGASGVLLASEDWAKKRGLPILATLTFGGTAAVNFMKGEGLLMAPTLAVSNMLKAKGLSLQDFDFYEIHEAFAAQVLCTLKAWNSEDYCRNKLGVEKALGEIDPAKMNIKGGSLAFGHPFAATGARIVGNLSKIVAERGSGRGLISICTAGGMGVAAIVEAI